MLSRFGISPRISSKRGFHREAGRAFLSDWSNSKGILLTLSRFLVALFRLCFAPNGVKVAKSKKSNFTVTQS